MTAKTTGTTQLNPATIAPPVGRYSHGIAVPAGARLLFVAGQIGSRPDGTVPSDFAEQARNAWSNLLAILKEGGMTADNLVKTTAYLTRPSDLPAYREVRASVAGEVRPTSVLVFVSQLADPSWLFEIEGVAAKA
jgi:enamine deaminase RidA (YjgF/YER057c/UK114 family)